MPAQCAGEFAMRLGERLVQAGLVSAEDVERALSLQQQGGGRIGSILVRLGALSEDALLGVLEQHTGAVLLRESELPAPATIYAFMSALPVRVEWWLDRSALLWEMDGAVHLLARDPGDSHLLDLLRYQFGERPLRR